MDFIKSIPLTILGICCTCLLNSGCKTTNIINASLQDDRRMKPAVYPHYEKDKTFIEFYNGDKVYGTNISHTSGVLGGIVKLDGKSYKIKQTKAIVGPGSYRHSVGKNYANCIIWGKIRVYELFKSNSGYAIGQNHGGFQTKTPYSNSSTKYYLQNGEDGQLELWTKLSQLREYIKDCPKAISMLNDFNKNSVKQPFNDSYLVKLIRVFNNNCQ